MKNLPRITLAILFFCSLTCYTSGQDVDNSEQEAWFNVDQMSINQLKNFIDRYPNGKFANDANFDLSLHQTIADIRADKVIDPVIIPFEDLGERWNYWCEAIPEKGALGVFRTESTAGMMRAMGASIMSTDYSGMLMVPTGDGSILAIKTNGLPYKYIGDIIFESGKEGTLYFAVIRDKGLVHIHGLGKITMPDGTVTELVETPEIKLEEQADDSKVTASHSIFIYAIVGAIILVLIALVVWLILRKKS